jgi:hypothetical protein
MALDRDDRAFRLRSPRSIGLRALLRGGRACGGGAGRSRSCTGNGQTLAGANAEMQSTGGPRLDIPVVDEDHGDHNPFGPSQDRLGDVGLVALVAYVVALISIDSLPAKFRAVSDPPPSIHDPEGDRRARGASALPRLHPGGRSGTGTGRGPGGAYQVSGANLEDHRKTILLVVCADAAAPDVVDTIPPGGPYRAPGRRHHRDGGPLGSHADKHG